MKQFIIDKVNDFNPDHIFDCGQCFRWSKQPNGSYTGTAFGKSANMNFVLDENTKSAPANGTSGTLIITNADEEDFNKYWRTYLDLDRDYAQIKKTLTENDIVMTKAVEHGQGIRILRQELWETLVSFIISQNNNIPRIKGCIENLAMMFGEQSDEFEEKAFYALPSPEKLASLTVEDLAPVRLGYRARYLIESAQTVCEKGLPENEEQLSSLCGVGPKVANCIMLFGMAKYDSFPIDVWMRRVMNRLYGIDENDKKAMTAYAQSHFAGLGGFAQQYLFYYIRDLQQE